VRQNRWLANVRIGFGVNFLEVVSCGLMVSPIVKDLGLGCLGEYCRLRRGLAVFDIVFFRSSTPKLIANSKFKTAPPDGIFTCVAGEVISVLGSCKFKLRIEQFSRSRVSGGAPWLEDGE
jgi:hypothetical protein